MRLILIVKVKLLLKRRKFILRVNINQAYRRGQILQNFTTNTTTI